MTGRVWRLSEEEEDIEVSTLSGHDKRVYFCSFNPAASDILATGACDGKIKIWDLQNGSEKNSIDIKGDVLSLAWNYNGSSVCCTSKGGQVLAFDPRTSGKATNTTKAHEGAKAPKSCWIDATRLVTTGFTKSATREIAVWDIRNLEAEVSRIGLERDAGSLMPFWDAPTGLLLIAGKGDTTVRIYQLNENSVLNKVYEHRSTQPQKSFNYVPMYSAL
eukprot:Selendium_serpulae@DN11905_c0_g1_i1.p1